MEYRKLGSAEMSQRWCAFCKDMIRVPNGAYRVKCCSHARCPYRELDGYRKYGDYLKATDCGLLGMLKGE